MNAKPTSCSYFYIKNQSRRLGYARRSPFLTFCNALTNPYAPTPDAREQRVDELKPADHSSYIGKTMLIVTGLCLYASTPWRDAMLYSSIQQHGGFPPEADSIAIGIAASFISMIFFSPIALFLIGYGIGLANGVRFLPSLRSFTITWGICASIVAALMIWIEIETLLLAVGYGPDWGSIVLTVMYMLFAYIWWCCSISHKRIEMKNGEPSVATKSPS